jgi:hypothetical protein
MNYKINDILKWIHTHIDSPTVPRATFPRRHFRADSSAHDIFARNTSAPTLTRRDFILIFVLTCTHTLTSVTVQILTLTMVIARTLTLIITCTLTLTLSVRVNVVR